MEAPMRRDRSRPTAARTVHSGLAPKSGGCLLLATFLIWSCGTEPGPLMNPGDDCLSCHGGGEGGGFSIAGTAYADPHANADAGVDGVKIWVTDATGKVTTLTSNAAGNFYTSQHVQPPLSVEVERSGQTIAMSRTVSTGACNACHNVPGADGAPGRLYAP